MLTCYKVVDNFCGVICLSTRCIELANIPNFCLFNEAGSLVDCEPRLLYTIRRTQKLAFGPDQVRSSIRRRKMLLNVTTSHHTSVRLEKIGLLNHKYNKPDKLSYTLFLSIVLNSWVVFKETLINRILELQRCKLCILQRAWYTLSLLALLGERKEMTRKGQSSEFIEHRTAYINYRYCMH